MLDRGKIHVPIANDRQNNVHVMAAGPESMLPTTEAELLRVVFRCLAEELKQDSFTPEPRPPGQHNVNTYPACSVSQTTTVTEGGGAPEKLSGAVVIVPTDLSDPDEARRRPHPIGPDLGGLSTANKNDIVAFFSEVSEYT